jgi:hypothetical protein
MKVIFVKPVWLFQSGDQALVPDRVGRWLTGNGYAYTARPPVEPVADVLPPLQPAPPEKPLVKRTSRKKK